MWYAYVDVINIEMSLYEILEPTKSKKEKGATEIRIADDDPNNDLNVRFGRAMDRLFGKQNL